MRHITRENLPCWFELSWDEKGAAIILRIHELFMKTLPVIKHDAPIVGHLKKEFGLASFSGDMQSDYWGFDASFRHIDTQGDFICFRVALPAILKITDRPCRRCNGKRTEEDQDSECFACNGEGKEADHDWHGAYALSATFSLFSMLTRYPETAIRHNGPLQLLTFQTITDHGQHGGSLDGDFSISLCSWLSRHPPCTPIHEVKQAMEIAYGRMFRLRAYDKLSFRATQRGSGIIHASCPGDACEIHPGHPRSEPYVNEGDKFTCHNVDSPLQQLTFLAGLAALHDKARKEIK